MGRDKLERVLPKRGARMRRPPDGEKGMAKAEEIDEETGTAPADFRGGSGAFDSECGPPFSPCFAPVA